MDRARQSIRGFAVASGVCLLALIALVWMPPAHAQGGMPAPIIEVIHETSRVHANAHCRLALAVTIAEGWHVNAHEPLDDYLLPTEFTFELPENVALQEIVYPEDIEIDTSFSDAPLAVYEGTFTVGLVLAVGDLPAGTYTVKATLNYQGCDDLTCTLPSDMAIEIPLEVVPADETLEVAHADVFESIAFGTGTTEGAVAQATEETLDASADASIDKLQGLTVRGQASGYMSTPKFLAFLDAAESGEATAEGDLFQGKSIWWILLLTLAGGLALNLTPCVLPMIPINIAIIGAGTKAGSRGRGFALGGTYGLGIALTYGILGLVVVLSTGVFGALNASPWFNLVIALLFVALGLALLDVWLFDLSRFQTKLSAGAGRTGFALAFVMGCVAALLSGACVAPVVVAVIVFAQDLYARGQILALALPFVLGLGMAIPWPLAGAGLSFLPKPGKWMTHVKHAFALVILLVGVYYGYETYRLFADTYFVDREAVLASAQQLEEEGWFNALDAALAEADKTGKPLLIDFWATWCKSCLAMNETTFQDDAVKQRLQDYVALKYQAQDLSDPATREILNHFGIIGLPAYIVLE